MLNPFNKPNVDYTFLFALLGSMLKVAPVQEINDAPFNEPVYVKLDKAGKNLLNWCRTHGYKTVIKHDWFTVVDYLDEFTEMNSCLAISAMFSRGFKTNN